MRVAIHQPGYFPWLGYLHKVARCERLVAMDDVAANKAAFQYRNMFYCNGNAKYLTLPVDYRLGVRLDELEFTRTDWAAEHLEKLRNYYRKAPAFREVFPLVEGAMAAVVAARPIEVMLASMRFLFSTLGLEPELVMSSALVKCGHKGDLVLSLCEAAGASTYLSGRGATEYMDKSLLARFATVDIAIEWLDFQHPLYAQAAGKEFLPGLSSLDLMFFAGIESARSVVRGFRA